MLSISKTLGNFKEAGASSSEAIRNIFSKIRNCASGTTNELNDEEESIEDSDEAIEVYSKIDRAKNLYKIMNATIDKEEFFNSLSELKEILNELMKYEEKYKMVPPPSEDLKYLESVENQQIKLLIKRMGKNIVKNKKKSVLIASVEKSAKDISQSENNDEPCTNSHESETLVSELSVAELSVCYPQESETSVDESEEYNEDESESRPYRSKRIIIGGLHIYFINVAREILEQGAINIIPLMREYNLPEDDINQIICEMRESNVIDENNAPTMSLEEFERFVDIYEPGLFKCKNCIFDKKNFTDIGEIIFEEGAESVYDILPTNEILDYLNIMESLKIISYDDCTNKYDILISKEEFYDICKSVPNFKKAESNTAQEINIDNMEGHDFEFYCADILRKNGFDNVEVTKGSGDHGIDILAEKDDITYAIQCKCYSSDIGNAAVQQAHTGKSIYRKDIAVVLTNRYFTAQAKEEAAALGVKLWDRDKLNSMIEKS